jgi:RHS repeat-associated protein
LDAFGIINMNGRVYDPATGMFFSSDPFIQSPGDWVNYNRYSYCMGNPMRYTDPSGYVSDAQKYADAAGKAWNDRYNYIQAMMLVNKEIANSMMSTLIGAPGGYEFEQAEEQMNQDRQDMADYANQHMLNGPNPNDVAAHFGGQAAQDAFGYMQDGYSMASATFYGTQYAMFSKGSFNVVQHEDGDITLSDPSAYLMTSSILNLSNGGGGSLGNVNTALAALGTLNSIGINIAHDYVSYGFKSANGWQEFGKLTSSQQAWRAASVLGENGARILSGAKILGGVAGVITTAYSGYKAYGEYESGGLNNVFSHRDVYDAGVGVIGTLAVIGVFSNPVGWAIGAGVLVYGGATLIYDCYDK